MTIAWLVWGRAPSPLQAESRSVASRAVSNGSLSDFNSFTSVTFRQFVDTYYENVLSRGE
jgi:MFS-type transporter involved in bile tolerance (Atg22 family)